MTYGEAIERIRAVEIASRAPNAGGFELRPITVALQMAVSAMEKQMPKIVDSGEEDGEVWFCCPTSGDAMRCDYFGAVVICAERYALGRMTCMADIVQRFIKDNIDSLDFSVICILISDIEDAGKLGWMDLLNFLREEKGKR